MLGVPAVVLEEATGDGEDYLKSSARPPFQQLSPHTNTGGQGRASGWLGSAMWTPVPPAA
jgi:hypothetical protein